MEPTHVNYSITAELDVIIIITIIHETPTCPVLCWDKVFQGAGAWP